MIPTISIQNKSFIFSNILCLLEIKKKTAILKGIQYIHNSINVYKIETRWSLKGMNSPSTAYLPQTLLRYVYDKFSK